METKDKHESYGNATQEDYDVVTPVWFYVDTNSIRQGPFSFKEMYLWWKGGYFPEDMHVKNVWESEFKTIGTVQDFIQTHPKVIERIEREAENQTANNSTNDLTSGEDDLNKYQDYSVAGGFNAVTGKFQSSDTNNYYANKGLPSDRDLRMMSHYFDYEKYSEQMNAAKEADKKKVKVKGSKKFWKERKEKKRRAKLIAEYLAD